ncbi:MAG: imidazolonepropionase [Gammaproteobacteria bacterium]|nr:imidazolonepropionase [Gammaproteobacteria bacterium]
MYDLLIKNARLHPMQQDAAVSPARTLAVNAGRIAALGVPDDAPAREIFDAENRVVLPGFVDCHTHALYAGDRAAEHGMRLAGASYADIAKAGGGIVTTVDAVRTASEPLLVTQTLPRLRALQSEGVTTIEIKSGYGLDTDNELKMLRAIRALRRHLDMDIVPTFLGAHSVPRGRERSEYLVEVIGEMLPAVAQEGLAEAADIFVEDIGFTVDDLRALSVEVKKHGLKLRAHTDQLSRLGATAAAAELGALSCDHLEYSSEEDVAAMARYGTVAVLLPGAFYFLRENRKPPVALLRQHGVPMAVATDLNPGSSPLVSLLAALHLAVHLFDLTQEEALLGVTRNAAYALGRADKIGSLAPGLHADFCVWDIPAPEFLVYQLGGIRPAAVFFKGKHT